MDHKGKLALAQEDFELRLVCVHASLCELKMAACHPLQDDWDDALNIATYQLSEAELYIDRAIQALREGSC